MNKLTSTAVTAVLGGAMVVGMATESHAATSIRAKALSTAAARKNDPYKGGAAGPNAFDCSGLVYYSYKKHGKTLPRTAQGQYNKATKVTKANRQIGDLVFFGGTNSIYHVGIYAGNGKIWNANSTAYRGRKVVLAPISEYGSNVHYARVK